MAAPHIWFNVNDADLATVQNVPHSFSAGAIAISFILTVLQEPAGH